MRKVLEVFKLNQNAKLPTRNVSTDAGADIYALNDVFIPVGQTKVIPTGIAICIPVGFVGKIEDRSSMARNGLRTGAGIVDTGYSGEVGVVLHNLTNRSSKDPVLLQDGYRIKAGDKIAQLLLIRIETPEIEEVNELWTSERGSNGFGSSGR